MPSQKAVLTTYWQTVLMSVSLAKVRHGYRPTKFCAATEVLPGLAGTSRAYGDMTQALTGACYACWDVGTMHWGRSLALSQLWSQAR